MRPAATFDPTRGAAIVGTSRFSPSEPRAGKQAYLEAHALFRDFTPAQLEPFHHTIRMAHYPAGHVFYRPGETGEAMFLLKEGAAQLYRLSGDGRKFVFADIPAASIFGEMACFGQAMHECFAQATEDSTICTLARDDVHRLVLQYPQFAVRLIEAIGSRLVDAERQLEALAFKPLAPRLVDWLRREARDGVVEGLSHQEIGERLGAHRESVTAALNELRHAGAIALGRRRIQILDPTALDRAGAS
jgi:CRP/FNR family transcriptional regulator